MVVEEQPRPHEETNARRFIIFTALAGVTEGGIVAYLPVMLARMGANAATVSMLNSGLALAIIGTALPSGPMVARQKNLVPFMSWWILAIRAIFVAIALVPFVSGWWVPLVIVGLWSLHGIPAAIVNNGIFGVLAEAVSARRRPKLNGVRWGLFGLVAAAVTGIFGYSLDLLPFPLGYQLIFLFSGVTGAIGVIFFRGIVIDPIVLEASRPAPRLNRYLDLLWPRRAGRDFLEFQILTTILRLGIHIPIGLFSIFWVNELQATDTWIGIRSTVANGGLVAGYFGWTWISARIGPRWTLGVSSAGMALFPGLTALGPTIEWMLPAALAWGIFVAGIDFALVEGLLRACPRDRRAELVAVHQFQANVVLFIAPLLGAWVAELTSIRTAMLVAVVFHGAVLVAVALMRSTYAATPENAASNEAAG